MSSLGDVLERLHTAWSRLDSAQGTMRLEYEATRGRLAWDAWAHGHPAGSVVELRERPGANATRTEAPGGSVREELVRFWMAKPWRWRVERLPVGVLDPSAATEQLHIVDGARWWLWSRGNDAITNAHAADPEQVQSGGVDQALTILLDPAPLSGTLRMTVTGASDHLGRPGDLIEATPRDTQIDPGLWPGADSYTLMADGQLGILLRAEARLAGERFALSEFTALELDGSIPEERFAFQPPPGVHVRSLPERRITLRSPRRR